MAVWLACSNSSDVLVSLMTKPSLLTCSGLLLHMSSSAGQRKWMGIGGASTQKVCTFLDQISSAGDE
jgi:hypothetical protein